MIEVTRPNTKEQVFRRYREFHELHTKMVSQFPDHTLPTLPNKIYFSRSQVRQVSLLIYSNTYVVNGMQTESCI